MASSEWPTINSTSRSWSSSPTGTVAILLPVAEHGDAVGEFEHLVEMVGDVQDRDPTRSQAMDHLEEALDVLPRQRRRRLVEDQQAGTVLPTDECSGDGDRRAVRLRQRVDGSLHVDVVEAEDGQCVTGALGFLTPVDAPAEARRVPGGEGDVLHRVERADEPEVLVDEPDSGRGRLPARRPT